MQNIRFFIINFLATFIVYCLSSSVFYFFNFISNINYRILQIILVGLLLVIWLYFTILLVNFIFFYLEKYLYNEVEFANSYKNIRENINQFIGRFLKHIPLIIISLYCVTDITILKGARFIGDFVEVTIEYNAEDGEGHTKSFYSGYSEFVLINKKNETTNSLLFSVENQKPEGCVDLSPSYYYYIFSGTYNFTNGKSLNGFGYFILEKLILFSIWVGIPSIIGFYIYILSKK